MSRYLVVLSLFVSALVGCQFASDAPPTNKKSADAPTIDESGTIDYAGWPQLTKEPVRIAPQAFRFCVATPRQQKLGPHFAPAIRLYANDVAADHLREERTGPLPVGATIVKEKWWNEKAERPDAYAAMIKREAGYDPDHGDWEYLYVSLGEKEKVERGKIESCIACHARAAEKDYLFRTHLKAE